MLETIILAVVLATILALLCWAAGWLLFNGTGLEWLCCGHYLTNAIGVVFTLLVEVITSSIDG